ncbi:site-specific DNA-methyltransferase [Fournierella sp.]|uniref:site-specific DNA-methyltransferase n=1 Tax=Allofournierella sp. TaxID=1940256 RepID=UPI0025BD6B2B|nr:site-specific DNA-methyltransferase [Fournierella sp.]
MARPKKLTEAEKMRDVEAYTHDDKKRTNNPPVGMAQHDKAEEKIKTYQFDPHLDPTLQWAGKAEGTSFEVPTSSIHIHESIKPHSIISHVMKEYSEALEGQLVGQQSMFEAETPAERMRRRRESIEFYQHGVNWTNRMIAGDSLVIMNSLLEKEGMAGQVQMVYIDPPYGIKYGSNFQPFVDKRDVKDKKDEDLSQEPEMIKAFRDTWELGIHSYLTYLRNRLLLARELLTDSGSVFIQISDENVHHVRELCDEIFSPQNFILQIFVKKTGGAGAPSDLLAPASVGDYIIWYAKDKKSLKYHRLFENKADAKSGINNYSNIRLPDGTERSLTPAEKKDLSLIPKGARLFGIHALTSQSGGENARFPIEYNGKTYRINSGSWKTSQEGIQNLIKADRIRATDTRIGYVRFFDDFPVVPLTNAWDDTRGDMGIIYVVQTATKIIQRCILMTTDPGDLVLDITCGSGTTAYVAEQWGRRWITCDTSRVAITLAKQRLMTATFDYYKLAHPEQGVGSGFVYKTVPHITLKSIANNEPPATETLYDQPEIDKGKVRITGPFTVEALPAPVVKPLDDVSDWDEDSTAKQTSWRDQLLATGIMGRGGSRLEFSRVEPLSGTKFLQAEAETKEDVPRRAVICFAGETKPMDSRMVSMALDEVETLRPSPKLIIFAAFQFDPEAAKDIDELNWPGLTVLKAQMNTDLMTDDLKKKRSSDQSFWLVGQPDVELIPDKRSKTRYKVKVNGFDYYDVKKGTVESGSTARIAMWMLDTDYDGMCIEPKQVFFPMGGKKDGWNKLAKTLKAEIDPDLIEKYAGNESLWFTVQPNSQIAVKIIDDRGIESLKVIKVGDE